MSLSSYPSPVNKLLTYGDCSQIKGMPDYVGELGFTSQHVPDLIRMACDEDLSIGADEIQDTNENLQAWAPVHAVRVLGQLHAVEAIEPLINLFGTFEEDDRMSLELPGVLATIGTAAIEPLEAYIIDSSHDAYERADAASALTRIAQIHPEARSRCVSIISNLLNNFTDNDPDFNAFLVGELVDLKAVEAAPIIEKAFAAESVPTFLVGDWNEVQIALGIKTRSESSNQFPLKQVIEYYTNQDLPEFIDSDEISN
jgi:HEAT repeat protein